MAEDVRWLDDGPVWLIAPYRGRQAAVSAALAGVLDIGLPEPGRALRRNGARIEWFALDQWLLIGAAPPPGLAAHAMLSDQTGGWRRLALSGPAAGAALARLVPVDVQAMKRGDVLRSEVHHVMVSLSRTGEGFVLGVGASFADTLAEEVAEAFVRVHTRAGLPD